MSQVYSAVLLQLWLEVKTQTCEPVKVHTDFRKNAGKPVWRKQQQSKYLITINHTFSPNFELDNDSHSWWIMTECFVIFKGNKIKPHWLWGEQSKQHKTWIHHGTYSNPEGTHTRWHKHLSTKTNTMIHMHTHTSNPRASSRVNLCKPHTNKANKDSKHKCPTCWFEAEAAAGVKWL